MLKQKPLWLFIGLLIISSVWLFVGLGKDPFVDYDEAAYAQVTAESHASGTILNLKFAHKDWLDKPPLYFLTALISSSVFSDIEFAYRFPSALFGLSCIILVWCIVGRSTRRYDIATIAAAALLFTGSFLEISRELRIDTAVTFFILLSYYAFIEHTLAETKRSSETASPTTSHVSLLIGVGIALGIMTKSIIGLFAFIPVAINSVLSNNYAWLKQRYTWIGAVLGLIIVLPWHIYQYAQHGYAFIETYIGVHVFNRYTTNLFPSDVSFTRFLKGWFDVSFPWSLVLIGILFFLIAYTWKVRMWWRERVQTQLPIVIMYTSSITAFGLLLVFSISKTKELSYLAPVYPFMAIAFGTYIYVLAEKIAQPNTRKKIIVALFVLFLFAVNTTYQIGFHKNGTYTLYNYETVRERAQIGALVGKLAGDETVYFYEADFWETVRYYSGNKYLDSIQHLPHEYQRPYYLIIPSEKIDEFSKPYAIVFGGKHLFLIRVNPEMFAFKI